MRHKPDITSQPWEVLSRDGNVETVKTLVRIGMHSPTFFSWCDQRNGVSKGGRAQISWSHQDTCLRVDAVPSSILRVPLPSRRTLCRQGPDCSDVPTLPHWYRGYAYRSRVLKAHCCSSGSVPDQTFYFRGERRRRRRWFR